MDHCENTLVFVTIRGDFCCIKHVHVLCDSRGSYYMTSNLLKKKIIQKTFVLSPRAAQHQDASTGSSSVITQESEH